MTAGLPPALEDTFRSSYPAVVGRLVQALGPARLELAEAAAQEAFARAVVEWRAGVPEHPATWLVVVARNLALDAIRRERTATVKQDAVARHLHDAAEANLAAVDARPGPALRGELADQQLAMMFVACHPCNTVASQIALALRTLCGLDVPAIARALLSNEDAVAKRLVLARRRLRDASVAFDLPAPDELGTRLDAVLRVLYLLFNEAYWCTTGPELVQEDVAAEAIRLTSFLADHDATRRPRVLALLALMYFHAARFPARVDAVGDPVALADQDRAAWDQSAVTRGLRCLAASAAGDDVSPYHLEAAIAALHTTSPSYAATDWARIVGYYDELLVRYPSPGARLSRAIAIGFRDDPSSGQLELARLADDPEMAAHAALHAARAELHLRAGEPAAAGAAFERAATLSTNPHERRWLAVRCARLR